jgi:UPF0755 protein
MKRTIFFTSISLLILGGLCLWAVVHQHDIPEAPREVITIPEGWTVKDINAYLKEKGVLVDGELSPDLEGYLFPDTYEFFLDSTTTVIQQKFQDNLKDQLQKIGLNVSEENLKQIVIMASLLEKEVKTLPEKRIVSGILWKRLESGMPLQVDATICYIKQTDSCIPISASDKKIDSEYNTYLYRGLPRGPICNPGADSILAAARPVSTPYWYYLSSNVSGETVFARTLDEHGQNIIKYLNE